MHWRRRRGLGFFHGVIVGLVLGVVASAAFGSALSDGARLLQQEELRWRIAAVEITSRTRTQAEDFWAQTSADIQGQLSGLTDLIISNSSAYVED